MKNINNLPASKHWHAGIFLKAILAFFIFNSSFLIPNCMCQWVPVLPGVFAYSLSASGNNIFAVAVTSGPVVYNVYKSTDYGINWGIVYTHQYLYSVAANGNYIFTGTNSPFIWGAYRSTDYGTTWNQAISSENILSFAVNGNYVYAGDDGGAVFISTNNGNNWAQTNFSSNSVNALALTGNNIYAGTYGGGVYLTTNNGTNWINIGLIGQYINALAINGIYVFAGTGTNNNGVYLTTNNGINWTQTSLNYLTVQSLAVNGNNIFAGTYANGVLVSTNNGGSWTARNEGLSGSQQVQNLCIFNNYIYAGTGTGIYRRPLSELVGIKPISSEIPKGFSLSQNYPNPFNPSTKIKFSFPLPSKGGVLVVSLIIYDVLGREIASLIPPLRGGQEGLQPGTYEADWNASDYPSGVYYYTLSTGEFSETRKAVLLK